MAARRSARQAPVVLAVLALLASGCGDDPEGEASTTTTAITAGAPEVGPPTVVEGKRGLEVVNEVERPEATRRGYLIASDAAPPELENASELTAAFEESQGGVESKDQAYEDRYAAWAFAVDYGQALLSSPGSGTSWVYNYAVPGGECVNLDASNARCTIYVYTEELGTGHAGVDRWIRREHVLAFRVGPGAYNFYINFVDFLNNQPLCSDANIAGIPLCSPNGPR